MLDYWEAFKGHRSRRVDTWTPTWTRKEGGEHIDHLDAVLHAVHLGDIETVQWGDLLIQTTSHLL